MMHSKHPHEVVAKGQCLACHEPHFGPKPNLLTAEGGALCSTCHADVVKATDKGSVHPPAKDGECLQCHQPHGGDEPGMLTQPATARRKR